MKLLSAVTRQYKLYLECKRCFPPISACFKQGYIFVMEVHTFFFFFFPRAALSGAIQMYFRCSRTGRSTFKSTHWLTSLTPPTQLCLLTPDLMMLLLSYSAITIWHQNLVLCQLPASTGLCHPATWPESEKRSSLISLTFEKPNLLLEGSCKQTTLSRK